MQGCQIKSQYAKAVFATMMRRRRNQACNETKNDVPKSSLNRMLTLLFSSRIHYLDEEETRSPCSEGDETVNPKNNSYKESNNHQHTRIIESPQTFLEIHIEALGQSFETIETLKNNRKEPSSLQLSSFHPYVIELVENEEIDKLRQLFDAGLSPDACNMYGVTIAHKMCRKTGSMNVLKLLIEYCCSLNLPDNFGRTILHDLCSQPVTKGTFQTIDTILGDGITNFEMFYVLDYKGSLPLDYVSQQDWKYWNKYIKKKLKEHLLLKRKYDNIDSSAMPQNSIPASKFRRKNSITPEVADMLASGKMKPSHVKLLTYEYSHFEDEEIDESNDDSCSLECFDDCEPVASTNPKYDAMIISGDIKYGCPDFTSFDEESNDDSTCYSMDPLELLDILDSTNIMAVCQNDTSSPCCQRFCIPSLTTSIESSLNDYRRFSF